MRRIATLFTLVLLCFLTASCGAPSAAQIDATVVVAVQATMQAQPTATPVTIEQTKLVIVTATPLPATNTPQPTPTSAATATPLPTATPNVAGNWKVKIDTSSFTDSTTVILSVDAEQDITGSIGSFRPTLVVRCQEKSPEVFVLVGMQPDVEVGIDGATVRLRFGDSKPFELVAEKSTSNEALFLPDTKRMIGALTSYDTLLLGFTPFSSNPVEMTFDIRGLPNVIEPLLKECPI